MLFLAFCVCLFCSIGNIVFLIEQKALRAKMRSSRRSTLLFVTDIMKCCIYSCMMLLQKKHDKIELTSARILFIIKTK